MQKNWSSIFTFIGFTIMCMNGCSNSSGEATSEARKHESTAAAETSQRNTVAGPVFAVLGADISGSYRDLIRKALETLKTLVMQANPGDEYFIRTISDASYLPKNAIAHTKFLDVPAVLNRFDRQGQRRRAAALAKLQAQKRNVVDTLGAMQFKPAPRTDIYGFIQAASDLFANAPNGVRKVLIFGTDLKDTAGFKCKPDLCKVEVIIFEFLVDADPITSQKRREEWVQRLKDWGAVKVTVRPAN
jgi:hypothetical protein